MKGKDVVFLSSDDWQDNLKTCKYHMSVQLAEDGYNVLFLNSIGLRTPKVSSGFFTKVRQRLAKMFAGVQRPHERIWVVTPFVVPFHRFALVNRINRFLLRFVIRLWMRRLGMKNPELWAFLPNHNQLLGQLDERVSLYYCVDEYSLFEDVDTVAIRALERDIVERVDLLVATARNLYDTKGADKAEKLYLPHGVDYSHFSAALDEATVLPDDMPADRPVVGFFGLIEEWIDLALVAAAARALPDYLFVMIGRTAVDVSAYDEVPNLVFPGARPYAELPRYCRAFSVGIMPFAITDMTVNVNPLKMREYLCGGMPVVSTPLPEAVGQSDFVSIADSEAGFIQAIRHWVEHRPDPHVVSASMKDASWSGRYRILRERIDQLHAD